MPTFAELQQRMIDAQHRKAIIEMLIEYIDENFRAATPEEQALLMLRDSNNLPVPESAFESFIAQVLVPIATECGEEVLHVQGMELAAATPAPAPAPAPVQQAQEPAASEEVTAGKKKGKKK